LVAAGTPLEKVFEHLIRGSEAGDHRALGVLRHAAILVGGRSPAIADALCEAALAIDDHANWEVTDELLAHRALYLIWKGNGEQAESICRQAQPRPHSPQRAVAFASCLAQILLSRGAVIDALQEVDRVLALAGGDRIARARLCAFAASGAISIGRFDHSRRFIQLANAEAGAAGDPYVSSLTLTNQGVIAMNRDGALGTALTYLERAVRKCDEPGGEEAHRFHHHIFLGTILGLQNRAADAQEVVRRGRRISEEIGAAWHYPMYEALSALVACLAGDWGDAAAQSVAAIELADQYGTRYGVSIALALNAFITLHRMYRVDELRAAGRLLDQAEGELSRTGPQWGFEYVHLARSLHHEASGDTVT
jgi:hypothetical protein